MVLFTALALLLLVSHALESSSADADANDTRGTPEPANLSSRIRILFPINDSVNALPLRFNCEIPVTTNSDFMRAHGDDLFCIEVNRSWRQCEPVATSRPLLRDLPAGNYSATVYLASSDLTSVLHNFAARQAIRSTWGLERALDRLGIKLLFVGCTPVFHNTDADKREALERAIEREKREFRDLFTHELACTDSYATLPDKVKQFFHYAATAHATIPYVMVADDDIYLQVAELARALREHGPRSRFYAGQVWTKQFLAHMLPNRDPDSKNFVSEGQYPMRFLPPFAFGPHFLLSMDCVEYIAENRDVLGNLSSLDDVSVALWLLALQSNASMCRGFDHASWLRGD
ncbi:hypothetical protein PybrP1_000759 [[Pythium] brassicae (nom. inval.)]|nr:hypothetical protein PybrP1_000759 [[Pythium] brassicae (nom. inval.)]